MVIIGGIVFIILALFFYISGSSRFVHLVKDDRFFYTSYWANMPEGLAAYWRVFSKIVAALFVLIGLGLIF